MALLLALFCLFVFVSAQFQFRFHTGGQQHREEESEDDKIEKARELAKVLRLSISAWSHLFA
jgi:hypothetical protein